MWEKDETMQVEAARLRGGDHAPDEPIRCESCGVDLTPTPQQLVSLRRWGDLRRPPCLLTPDGFHRAVGRKIPLDRFDSD
jgi:hypothetical protein